MKRLLAILSLSLIAVFSFAQPMEDLLVLLDGTIADSDKYRAKKEVRIKTIENPLHSRGISAEQRYAIYGQLYEEYLTYKFAKASEALDNQETAAREIGDKRLLNEVLISRAMINATGGRYLEASNILQTQIDTTILTDEQKIRYWDAQQRFWFDYREYANWSYYEARICEQLDRTEEMDAWFIRSAIADLKTATTDNASLCSLSQDLFVTGDLERAFRYITKSLDDARFYDAWLRQWQIAEVFPDIQRGYEEFRARQVARSRILLIAVSVLALITLLGAFWVLNAYKRQRRLNVQVREMNRQIQEFSSSLQQMNDRLTQTNSELSEANAAKEEYIGIFVSLSSDYIDKTRKYQSSVRKRIVNGQYDDILSEISSQKLLEEELNLFYRLFDQAFLKLYPDFVNQFNGLLKPAYRIEPKEGELLTTELRIFALIRLGITQSSRIASLLRYSVNTIYNYRAQIKKGAIVDKEVFEEKVRLLCN